VSTQDLHSAGISSSNSVRSGALRGQRSALDRIRRETRALHEQIEGIVPLLQSDADEQTYRAYLEKLLGFHRPLEPVLFARAGLHELGIRRAEREKSPWLARDLLALGLSAEELIGLPRCRALPPVPSLSAALGCCYVLEGATLGAQLIYRELSARLPDTMSRASSYLRCYGAETGRMWKVFCAALEHHGQQGEEQAEMADAARATFTTLRAWLLGVNGPGRA
jgi:heme oxygenase